MIFVVKTTPSELNLLGKWQIFCEKRNWSSDLAEYSAYECISLSEDEAFELGFIEHA